MKRIVSLLLSVMIIIGSVPAGYIFSAFAVGEESDKDALSVGYFDGMTVEDFVDILNSATGLPDDTSADEWEWFTKGEADYSYGRYLVDVEIDKNAFFDGISKKDVDVLRALEVYDRYKAGEITKEEVSKHSEAAQTMFFDINIDAEELRRAVNDAIRSAERSFRSNGKYVSLSGETIEVSNKTFELDYRNDPHCVYTYKIILGNPLPDYEGTLYLPTTLEVKGSEKYPSVIDAVSAGKTVTVKHGNDVYSVDVYGVERSELVLKPCDNNTYFISYNKFAGDTEADILSRIYSEVVDFEKSTLSPDFDSEAKNGFTVRFYDGRTGWYEFSANEDRLVAGKVYEVEIIYSGITTVSEEFSVALYDPRKEVAVAFYDSETLAVSYTTLDGIKQAVFSTLVDISDIPDVTYSDFEYYYYVGDFGKLLEKDKIDDIISSERFEELLDKVYNKVWDRVQSIASKRDILKDIDKETFRKEYFNVDYLKKCLAINDWILFDGQPYAVTVEIEGENIELFTLDIPSILAGFDYRIKVVYKGSEDELPAEAVSPIKNLHIIRRSSQIEINDGSYEAGKLDGMINGADIADCIMVAVKVDVDYIEMTNVYLQIPSTIHDRLTLNIGDKNVNIADEILNYATSKDITVRRVRNYINKVLEKFDEKFDGSSSDKVLERAQSVLNRVDKVLEALPEGLQDAKISLNGIPQTAEGVYLVGAISVDINSVPNFDYGIIGICTKKYDNTIIFDYEIPEDQPLTVGESFDFGANVYTPDLEPVEGEYPRYCFIGNESGTRRVYFSGEAPTKKGQYVQIAISDSAAPAFRFFDIGLLSVNIAPSDSEYEYDGLPHGEPIITDIEGNILPLRSQDQVVYTNIITGETHRSAPSKVGHYFAEVYYAGDSDHKKTTAQYEFTIVPKKVNVSVGDYSMVYGDNLPEFVIECDDPEILAGIVYTVTPEVAYKGNVGTYGLIINIQSMPEGYTAVKTSGTLTVTPRPITIQMQDITLTYGDDYDPQDSVYYSVVEGEMIGDDVLGLGFEKFSHAGVYEFAPVSVANGNYDVSVIPGTITILPRTIELRIEDEFIYEGDALPEFTIIGEVPEGLIIHIAAAYYDGSVGTYSIIGVAEENSDYIVYIEDGILTVRRRPAKEVVVTVPDQTIVYGDPLPKFTYETSEEVKGVEFTVDVVDYEENEGRAGVYALLVTPSAYNSEEYRFIFNIGQLYVVKKTLSIKVSDYTDTYGNEFDPTVEYKFESSDPSINLSEILKNHKIGAEFFNGEAGSYLLIGKADADNYDITVESGTLTILPKLIQVTPLEGQGKKEGEEDTVIEYLAYGLIGDDELQGSLSREPGEEVGLYLITPGTLDNKNYEIDLDKEYYAIRSDKYEDVIISSLPNKLVYLEGEEFDPTGLEVKAILKDGTEIILTYGEDYIVEGFDTTKPGTQKLTIKYEGYVNSFKVEVKESGVILVKIDTLPTKLDYIEGQEFDPDGIGVIVFFDNGTHRYAEIEELEFAGFDTNTLGTQTISVSFRGVSDSFDVNVVEKQLAGIEVDTSEAITEFYDEDSFSAEGLKVYMVYDSGIKELIPTGEYTITAPSTDTEGEKTVVVSYEGFTAEYTVNVTTRTVLDLELVYEGDMISCVINGDFNDKAIVVTAHFNNGTQKVLTYGEYTVDNFSSEKIGIYNSEIIYRGVSKGILIKIEASVIESIEVTNLPDKTIYMQGDSFDPTGIVVESVYTNGDRKVVEEYTLSGFDTNTIGRQSITVKYLGFTTDFSVYLFDESFNGIRVNTLPEKTSFVEKTEFSCDGIEVVFDTNDGLYVIPAEDLTVITPDMTVIGKQDVCVEYANSTYKCAYEIEILEKTAVSITVDDSCPDVFVCIKGEAPDVQGETVTVVYDNGEVETIALSSDMITGFDDSKLGCQNALIEYQDAQTDCLVWVVKSAVKRIQITRRPGKLIYPVRSEFDATGLEVLVEYENGDFEAYNENDCLISGYDMTEIGEQTVTVRFANCTDTYNITVNPRQIDRVEIAEYPECEYVAGSYFSADGMVVYVYYDNGECEELDPSEYTVIAPDPDTPLEIGEYPVVVEYGETSVEFTITVVDVKEVGIRVDTTNGKTKYHQDNCFEDDGFHVYIVYNDGSETEIDISDCEIVGFNTSEVGQYTVSVVYGEFSYEFDIIVLSGDGIVKAELVNNGMSLTTVQGTMHDFSLLRIEILYNDGTHGYITNEVYEVRDYDHTVYGEYNAKIVYKGFVLPIDLSVVSRNVSIEVDEGELRKDYLVGEEINPSTVKVYVLKTDGSKEEISDAEFVYDFSSAGKTTVKVIALGFETEFEVNVFAYGAEDIIATDPNGKFYVYGGYIIVDDFKNTTTFSEFKEMLVCPQFISIDLEDDDLINTNLVITVVSEDKTYAQYTVIVKGDLNGDGRTDVSDLTLSRRALSGWTELDEIQAIAADVAENNGFNITDIVTMVRFVETLV